MAYSGIIQEYKKNIINAEYSIDEEGVSKLKIKGDGIINIVYNFNYPTNSQKLTIEYTIFDFNGNTLKLKIIPTDLTSADELLIELSEVYMMNFCNDFLNSFAKEDIYSIGIYDKVDGGSFVSFKNYKAPINFHIKNGLANISTNGEF